MGAVLNQVSTGGKPYYHYGKYYRYGYYHQYDYPGYYGEDKRA
jgi:glucan phosphorylase